MEVNLLLRRACVPAFLDYPFLIGRGEARRRKEVHQEGVSLSAVPEQPLRDLNVVEAAEGA